MTVVEWPEGLKKTKQRDAVLTVLEHAEGPLSAMEICGRIGQNGETVWLSTVYRSLELFTEKGLALKTTVLDGDVSYYELNRHVHQHYAVCVGCHKIVAIAGCPVGDYTPEIQEGFRVLGHRVEMYGYCKDCDRRKKS